MQVRSFVFTFHNWNEDTLKFILAYFKDARYIVIGKEWGKSGETKHLQGYVQLNKRMTLKKIGGLFPWHVEKVMGTPDQAATYCKKENDFIELGTLNTCESGGKSTQDKWRKIVDLAKSGSFPLIEEEYPGIYLRCLRNLHMVHAEALSPLENEKKCLWLWGKPGTGKSRFARDFDNNGFYKLLNKWWDGYRGQKTIILDDFSKDHKCLGSHLKRWADRYPITGEIKGSVIPPHYDTLIVTANYTPEEIFEDEMLAAAIRRRFIIIRVLDHEIDPEGILWITTDDGFNTKKINKFNVFDT